MVGESPWCPGAPSPPPIHALHASSPHAMMQEIQETWVQFLGQEDPLEKRMATHSSVLAWEIPWTEEPSGPQSSVSNSQSLLSTHTQTHTHTHTHTDTHTHTHTPSKTYGKVGSQRSAENHLGLKDD